MSLSQSKLKQNLSLSCPCQHHPWLNFFTLVVLVSQMTLSLCRPSEIRIHMRNSENLYLSSQTQTTLLQITAYTCADCISNMLSVVCAEQANSLGHFIHPAMFLRSLSLPLLDRLGWLQPQHSSTSAILRTSRTQERWRRWAVQGDKKTHTQRPHSSLGLLKSWMAPGDLPASSQTSLYFLSLPYEAS